MGFVSKLLLGLTAWPLHWSISEGWGLPRFLCFLCFCYAPMAVGVILFMFAQRKVAIAAIAAGILWIFFVGFLMVLDARRQRC